MAAKRKKATGKIRYSACQYTITSKRRRANYSTLKMGKTTISVEGCELSIQHLAEPVNSLPVKTHTGIELFCTRIGMIEATDIRVRTTSRIYRVITCAKIK